MSLALVKNISDSNEYIEVSELKKISKFWNLSQWRQYLKNFELQPNEEEIYVGTSIELEKYVARKSRVGFVLPISDEE